MTDDAFSKASEEYDPGEQTDSATWDEHRSILRISPANEAANCESPEDCRELIESELERDEPRQWIIALFNERMDELA